VTRRNPETEVRNSIRLACNGATRLFNNPVGEAWAGNVLDHADGRLVLGYPRRVAYGLCPGSSDLIGFTAVTITPEMVGRTVAVMTAVEVKTARGTPTAEQLNFIDAVRRAGGIAGVARSPEEALALIAAGPGATE
jgi:hypothetical protein